MMWSLLKAVPIQSMCSECMANTTYLQLEEICLFVISVNDVPTENRLILVQLCNKFYFLHFNMSFLSAFYVSRIQMLEALLIFHPSPLQTILGNLYFYI